MISISPQPGPQQDFLSSAADIAIYGGAAGGGKTWGLLLEPLRHTANAGFAAVVFRRTTVQIDNPGGLWDASSGLYPLASARALKHRHLWRFPSGAALKMAHLEHEKHVLNWQGAEIPLILWDELTHFLEAQFWYLLSRNRSTCGVRPYMRATCNPDADSWVAGLVAWWIDQVTGLPIPERAGVLRWFVRVNDEIIWGDRPEDLAEHTMLDDAGNCVPIPPKSLTFIPSKLTDNPALMRADPGYLSNLLALPRVERERLLGGNWKVRASAGLMFQRGWVKIVDAVPTGTVWARGWDLAATEKTASNDPDWTCGTRIGRTPQGRFIVADHVRVRGNPGTVLRLIANTASSDGKGCAISLPQDPGQAGKSQAQAMAASLAGLPVRFSPETGDKVTRFSPFSAQAEAGNVDVLRGTWNDNWLAQLEAFPEAAHDDDADSTARAFSALQSPKVALVGPVILTEPRFSPT